MPERCWSTRTGRAHGIEDPQEIAKPRGIDPPNRCHSLGGGFVKTPLIARSGCCIESDEEGQLLFLPPPAELQRASASMTYTHKRANRQYVAMTNEEVWKFLESRDRIFVAFPTPSGFPHVTPVWFCMLDGKIYLRTQEYKVKTKLATSGKVCCSIDDGKYYRELRGVVIWGNSRVLTDPDLIQRVSAAISVRYKQEQWKESEMPKSWVRERKKERRTYIEIVPERISSWDNAKLARLVDKSKPIAGQWTGTLAKSS